MTTEDLDVLEEQLAEAESMGVDFDADYGDDAEAHAAQRRKEHEEARDLRRAQEGGKKPYKSKKHTSRKIKVDEDHIDEIHEGTYPDDFKDFRGKKK